MRVSTNFIDFLSAIFLAQNLLTPSFLISSPSTNFYHFLPTFILLSPTFTSFYKFLWPFRNFTNFYTTFTNFHQLLPNFILFYQLLPLFSTFHQLLWCAANFFQHKGESWWKVTCTNPTILLNILLISVLHAFRCLYLLLVNFV